MKRLPVVLIFLVGFGATSTSAQREHLPRETLREAVLRTNGPVNKVMSPPLFVQTSLEELLNSSDLVVQGTLGEPRSYVSDDGGTIYTDYVVREPQVLYSATVQMSPKPGPAADFTLTQLGGSVLVEGQPVSVRHLALEPLKAGTHGVFLLVRRQDKNFILRDYLGVIEIQHEIVSPLGELRNIAPGIRGTTVTAFRRDVVSTLQQRVR